MSLVAAFSTSGPRASVALLDGPEVLFAGDEPSQGRAGEACLALFERGVRSLGLKGGEVEVFAADLGPGSFTGVRVGIVLAKTLAWAQGAKCAGADAFDLVSPSEVVCLPSRRGEWFVRTPGAPIERSREEPPVVGVPLASGFARLSLSLVSPYELVPAYLLEPSISTPKAPFRVRSLATAFPSEPASASGDQPTPASGLTESGRERPHSRGGSQ